MADHQPKKVKLPEDAKPYRNTTVVIENERTRTVIWLELSEESRQYKVRKVVESKGQNRH